MESLRIKDGVGEVKVKIENAENEMKRKSEKDSGEIPPADVRDLKELGPITDLGKSGDIRYENAGIDFASMISDFSPENEEKLQVTTPYVHAEKELVDPPAVLPSADPSLVDLEKQMEIPPPEEIASGGEGSSTTTGATWDFERMEWIWSPCTYEEYERLHKQG